MTTSTNSVTRAQAYGNSTVTHDELAEVLWQTRYDPDRHASTLKSTVRRLRARLGALELEVLAEPGGYRGRGAAPALRGSMSRDHEKGTVEKTGLADCPSD